MQEHVTLLGPEESPADVRGLSSSLPPDLMEQVRGRVRPLALLLLVAFSFDPLVYFSMWAIATVAGYPVILGPVGFRLLDLGMVAASGALWWVARSRAVSADRLHALGLFYQVAICFTLALPTFWQSYLQEGIIPSLTWVPVVVHHVHTAPPPPSARAEQPIPPALGYLVLACLAKDPTERPQSARELSIRLGEITGAGVWTEDRAREWWSKLQPVPG